MIKCALPLTFALLLSACQGSPMGDAIAGPEALAQRDDAYCRSIGATPGRDIYVQCRMQAAAERQEDHRAYRARAAQMYSSMQASRVRTTCTRFGSTVTCN